MSQAGGSKVAKAAVFAGDRRVDVVEVEPPQPGEGQVRVRLEGCGVCASNLPVWEGRPWFNYPMAPGAPGHEGWGVIDALGPGVADFAIGDRVAVLSYNAYAAYDLAAASGLVRLPPSLGNQAFPGEPLGCAMNIFLRSGIDAGHTVAIIGIGFLGALLTELCTRAGAWVIALSRRPYALETAREYGASEVVAFDDPHHAAAQIKTIAGADGCDRVIEVTGYQSALDLATEVVGVRGRLVIAGYHQDGMRQIDLQVWNWKGLDVINAHERDAEQYVDGMRLAVEAVVDGRLHPVPLYTHTFPLAELGQAFEALRQRPQGFLKALVLP
jgi:threonine dehydrogenase-like Zn-dependent dehydrogenase